MLGIFADSNPAASTPQDQFNNWKDSLQHVSAEIDALPTSEQKDTLRKQTDDVYQSMMNSLPQLKTNAFQNAYCKGMIWLAHIHYQIHHGEVDANYGQEFSSLPDASSAFAGLGDDGGGATYDENSGVVTPSQILDPTQTMPPPVPPMGANFMYPVTNFPIVETSVTDPTPSMMPFPTAAVNPPSAVSAAAAPAPKSTSIFDSILAIGKAAPAGIKTYYNIETENALLKAAEKAPTKQAPSLPTAQSKTNWTPIIVGVLGLALIGGGVAIFQGRKKGK